MAQMNPLEGGCTEAANASKSKFKPKKTKALTAVTKRIMIEEFGRAY